VDQLQRRRRRKRKVKNDNSKTMGIHQINPGYFKLWILVNYQSWWHGRDISPSLFAWIETV